MFSSIELKVTSYLTYIHTPIVWVSLTPKQSWRFEGTSEIDF